MLFSEMKRSPWLQLHNPPKSTQMCSCMIEISLVLSKKSSVVFRDFWKMFGNDRLAFRQLLENLWKYSEKEQKSLENRQKSCHQYVYVINRIIHGWNFSQSVHLDISQDCCVRYEVEHSKGIPYLCTPMYYHLYIKSFNLLRHLTLPTS